MNLGGSIIPMQQPAYSIEETRLNPMSLVVIEIHLYSEAQVAFNTNGEASGDFFWDDGDTINTTQNGQYTYITYQAQNSNGSGSLSNQIIFDGYIGTSKQVKT